MNVSTIPFPACAQVKFVVDDFGKIETQGLYYDSATMKSVFAEMQNMAARFASLEDTLRRNHRVELSRQIENVRMREVTNQTLAIDLAKMKERKDAAYAERNAVVSFLSKCFPAGTGTTAIEGWSSDWHNVVYIDLPCGQASWHYHDSQVHLFSHLTSYKLAYDGHTTEEKYKRMQDYSQTADLTHYDSNVLQSATNWFESRSNTVWANQFGYTHLMQSYAKDLEDIRNRRTPEDIKAFKITTYAQKIGKLMENNSAMSALHGGAATLVAEASNAELNYMFQLLNNSQATLVSLQDKIILGIDPAGIVKALSPAKEDPAAEWTEASALCEEAHVKEALFAFGDSASEDNAIGLVAAVIRAYKASTKDKS